MPAQNPFNTIEEQTHMSQLKRLSAILLAFAFASILGCAGSATKESTGEYFDDTWITTKVKAAMFSDPEVKSAQINVETFKGVVQLSGFVSSYAAMQHAVKVARSVQGVTSVKNDMRIK
jgi:osmotically-inducible protein OsmY